MTILVTGSTGFLGRHLLPVLAEAFPGDRIVGVDSGMYDLLDAGQAERMMEEIQPHTLVHLACLSGGLVANTARPADFLFKNLVINGNVFEMAARHGVGKLIYPMGGCSYPATARSPIGEEQMWEGIPHNESLGYAAAKKVGIIAAQCYEQQYGMKTTVLVPGNMYGEYDNYHPDDSHVVAGLIRRMFEAKREGAAVFKAWGDGSPIRDFVYAGDVAAVFPYFIKEDAGTGPFNVSTGQPTRIRDLVEMVARRLELGAPIEWDPSKPIGQIEKIYDPSQLNALGLFCRTSIEEGLDRTVAWFAGQYDVPGAIRL